MTFSERTGRRRRGRLFLLGSLAAVFVLVAGLVGWYFLMTVPPPRPNVLLIVIDTLRADHLGCYGYGVDTSPNLDGLAKTRGVLFEQVVAAAPSTTPSHASMFTSMLPTQHGAFFSRRSPLIEERTTLAELLSDAGYQTLSVNDGGQVDARWGLAQGFDRYLTLEGRAPKARFERTVEAALPMIESASSDPRPWFAFLHTYETHHPYNPDAEFYRALGHSYDGPLPAHIDKPLLQKINDGEVEVGDIDRAHIVAAYDAEIRSMDRALGSLLSELKSRGLDDNTVVIFTSDHGEELGERGKMGWHSHTLYDEQLLVPMIVVLPGGFYGGTRIPDQVRGIDLMPTVLELADRTAPSHAQGASVLPLVRGHQDVPRPAVSQRDVPLEKVPTSLRSGQQKLYLCEGCDAPLLFDLTKDPGEASDLVGERGELAGDLTGNMARLLGELPRAETRATVVLDGGLLERLEALGYVESADAGTPGGDR